MDKRQKTKLFLILFSLTLIFLILYFSTGNTKKEIKEILESEIEKIETPSSDLESEVFSIDLLTEESVVVAFVKEHNRLPDYYITKGEAKKRGWTASKGNLCDVLPGKAIGGDRFGNREGKLPKKKGRQYYEADLNYDCGRRNADRLVYSNDGLVYVTKDHYQTFQKQ